MKTLVCIALVLAVTACSGTQRPPAPTTGTIAGLARDQDSGDPIAKAEIRITTKANQSLVAISTDRGMYDLDHLQPGMYELVATFAGQPVRVKNIEVSAGKITMVDIVFTLGRPDPIVTDYTDVKSKIDRYHPKNLTDTVSIIEGTVNDSETHQRVSGAVVTAVAATDVTQTQQTVSDDYGRFRFDSMPPGTYSVSAFYSISGRGQIEVRRSGIAVAGAEAVVVPLWIEMNR
ncbi:MAG: carboxypeptidase-like regulatory domain-containing protein [Kofleriaceae bacterium]